MDVLRQRHPDLSEVVVRNAPIEQAAPELESDSYDVVFTMAVLEHIHRDSEWVFGELVRCARRFVVTIEDEGTISERHFPRNYGAIFQALGLEQIENVKDLKPHGFPRQFVARVFAKHGG